MNALSEPLRVLVVDDEPLARRRLEILLRETPDVAVVGMAGEGTEARRMIAGLAPDVVLLDIKMPGLSGFDVLDGLTGAGGPPGGAPIVIFVTAFDRFAVEAFDRAAFDYLLKPVEPERLTQALRRARATLAGRGAAERIRELEEIVANLRGGAPPSGEAAPTQAYDRELWIQDRGDRLSLPVAALDWVAAERDYVRLHAGARSFLVRQPLGDLEARLDPRHFVRVHRSALVRIDRIARVRRTMGRTTVVLTTGAEVPVSRRHLRGLKAATVTRPSVS